MSETMNPRQAYGEALVALGARDSRVVALDADLSKSTMSCLFQQAYPDRFFEMGIAEQSMVSTAAGLAAYGKIPFCHTFAVFLAGRAYDQIRQTVSIGRLNVKLCGSSAGLSDFGDGSTHQSVEDLALMCAIPGMTVLTPCDALETRQAVEAAAQIDGPAYIRVVRNDLPVLLSPDSAFVLGQPRVLREGKDVLLAAHGSMVSRSLDAARRLAQRGIEAKVVSLGTMKPFPYEEMAALARGVRAVVTAEEHSRVGGLASHMAMALRRMDVPMDYVAVEDCFGQSAHSGEELMEHYGLTSDAIERKARALLGVAM